MNNMYTLQMIAAQALYDKYGFCPAFEQVKILESFNNEEYMLFRVREHEYRLDKGELINIEDQTKSENYSHSEEKIKTMTKHYNELRFENRRLKDTNKRLEESKEQLKKERDEYIKLWLSIQEERDDLEKKLGQIEKDLSEREAEHAAVLAAQRKAAYWNARFEE